MFRLLPTSPNDGYTRTGFWRWGEGPTQVIGFKYRPALPERAYEYGLASKRTGQEKTTETVALLGEHLVGINGVVDENGKSVLKITEDVLRRLPQPFLERALDCICGYTYEELADDLKNFDGVSS